MPENHEAIDVFEMVVSFLGEGLELPDCLPWVFEILDVVDQKAMLEKVRIIQGAMRQREVEKVKEIWRKH